MPAWHPHIWRRVNGQLQCETCQAVRPRRTRPKEPPLPAFDNDIYHSDTVDRTGPPATPDRR